MPPSNPAYPSPYQPSMPKRRPSWAWFLVGGVLMALGVVVAAVVLGRFAVAVDRDDALFRATGTHDVILPPHEHRGIFVVETDPMAHCNVTHTDGSTIDLEPPTSGFTYRGWLAVRVFDTGDGMIRFQCRRGGAARIRIAMVPEHGDYVRARVFGLAVPGGLVGIGFLVVLINGILWFVRRPATTYPPPPPGWQPPPPGWPPRA